MTKVHHEMMLLLMDITVLKTAETVLVLAISITMMMMEMTVMTLALSPDNDAGEYGVFDDDGGDDDDDGGKNE